MFQKGQYSSRKTSGTLSASDSTTDPLLTWARGIGGAGTVLGAAGIFLTEFYAAAVVLIYIGLAVLAADLLWEPKLRKIAKVIIALAIAGAAGLFTWKVVFAHVPLDMAAMITDAPYKSGETVNGIKWWPEFTELKLVITNPTGGAYTDLKLLVRPTLPVTAISQISNLPDVSFDTWDGASMTFMDQDTTGARRVRNYVLLATDGGYYVYCPSLPAGASLILDMAIGRISEVKSKMIAPQEVITFKHNEFRHWYGPADSEVFEDRINPERVNVAGSYKAVIGPREIKTELKVAGAFNIHPGK